MHFVLRFLLDIGLLLNTYCPVVKRVENGEIKDTHLARELGLSNNTYFKYKRELKKGI